MATRDHPRYAGVLERSGDRHCTFTLFPAGLPQRKHQGGAWEAVSTGSIALYMSLWLDSVYETVVHLLWAQVPLPWDSSATVPAPAHPVQLTRGTTWGCEVTSLRPSEEVCRLGEPGRCQDYERDKSSYSRHNSSGTLFGHLLS